MFERYTEKARRVIFFARYEASQFGSPYIETEYLLLGIVREDPALTRRFLFSTEVAASIRKRVEQLTTPPREPIATSVDLPLSNECKRVLAYAAEEAERLAHKHIGTEHLFLGLLREEHSIAATILFEKGVSLVKIRQELGGTPEPAITERSAPSSAPAYSVYLTTQAEQESLLPLIGRERELGQVMQVLSRMNKNNVVLVGETGTGKRAIAEGLAQRIVDSRVSTDLADKRIAALNFSLMSTKDLVQIVGAIGEAVGREIFYLEELHEPDGSMVENLPLASFLKPLLLAGKMQCISTATPAGYAKMRTTHPWLEQCFQLVWVAPLSEDDSLNILVSVRKKYEGFHDVTYTDDALKYAVLYSSRFVPGRYLPEKAIDLIDDAGAAAKLRHNQLPDEVLEIRNHVASLVRRQEKAVQNFEFEKARFYSEEERNQRLKMRELMEKHQINEPANIVTRDDIEETVSRWTRLPVSKLREAVDSVVKEPNEGGQS